VKATVERTGPWTIGSWSSTPLSKNKPAWLTPRASAFALSHPNTSNTGSTYSARWPSADSRCALRMRPRLSGGTTMYMLSGWGGSVVERHHGTQRGGGGAQAQQRGTGAAGGRADCQAAGLGRRAGAFFIHDHARPEGPIAGNEGLWGTA
jgi:N-methylhydantoinase B/oxoprolinase/acetone carboxylase alpha subunit